MGIRQKLKAAFLRIKQRGHKDRKPFSPPQSTIRGAAAFYLHPNEIIQHKPIRPASSHVPSRTANIQEELEFAHKSYTTASGVVIPPDFSYDRPKEVYRVSGIFLRNGCGMDMESEHEGVDTHDQMDIDSELFDGDNEASIFGDSEVPTASDYSVNTLSRMTELALTAHENSQDKRLVHIKSSRPLPEVPENVVGDALPVLEPGRIRILIGRAMRRVLGIRIRTGGNTPARIVRIIGGGEMSSSDEQPRPVRR